MSQESLMCPTNYTIAGDVATSIESVIALVSEGKLIREACAEAGITKSSLYYYLNKDPELQKRFQAAGRIRARENEDELIKINQAMLNKELDPQTGKAVSDNLKWLMARQDSSKYGDKVEHTGSIAVPVFQVVTGRVIEHEE